MAAIFEILIQRIEKLDKTKIRLVAMPPLPITSLINHVDSHYNNYLQVQEIRVRP